MGEPICRDEPRFRTEAQFNAWVERTPFEAQYPHVCYECGQSWGHVNAADCDGAIEALCGLCTDEAEQPKGA